MDSHLSWTRKVLLKKEHEDEPSQHQGTGQAGLWTKAGSFGPGGGKFCPKLTKAAGVWQFPLCTGEAPLCNPLSSPWREHAVMATASVANPPRVSGPKTEIWRKGSKIGFLLKDHINCKLLTNELLKPVLVRMVWINCSEGADCGLFSQHDAGEGGCYTLIMEGKTHFFAWIIWKLWISLLFLFQWSTDKSCVKWGCCLSVRQL